MTRDRCLRDAAERKLFTCRCRECKAGVLGMRRHSAPAHVVPHGHCPAYLLERRRFFFPFFRISCITRTLSMLSSSRMLAR